MAEKYAPGEIEGPWQKRWADARVAFVDTAVPGDEFYMLNMFPYPSGSRLHVGHGRNYILGDALYRRERMAGRKALNPMGWDAFGLPAENAAIQSGIHPREHTLANIGRMKEQFYSLGLPLRLVQGARLVRPGVLPVEPVAVPADVGTGTGVPEDRARQLVPGLPHGARQRAGRRRAVRAVRRRSSRSAT